MRKKCQPASGGRAHGDVMTAGVRVNAHPPAKRPGQGAGTAREVGDSFDGAEGQQDRPQIPRPDEVRSVPQRGVHEANRWVSIVTTASAIAV